MTIQVPHSEDFILTTPLVKTGDAGFKTTATLAAADAKIRTALQALTELSAKTVAFTSGSEEPKNGDRLYGVTSSATAIYMGSLLSSGTWAGGDAAGQMFVKDDTGTWQAEVAGIQGGTADVMNVAAALTDAGIAEVATTGEIALAITAAELATDRAYLLVSDATGEGTEWEDTAERIETYGHPLAADDRGVLWAGYLGLHNKLTWTTSADTETVIVGARTYTIQATLTDSDGNFKRGATEVESMVNFACALQQYEAIDFTSGSVAPSVGDTLSGDSSSETCVVQGFVLTSGTWAGADAAGWLMVSGASGAFSGEDLTNDTTSAANVLTISGDFTGSASRWAASTTVHALVKAGLDTANGYPIVYTLDGIIPQRIACSDTLTSGAFEATAMLANIDPAGTWVDLPDAQSYESPTNNNEANDHYIVVTDENGTRVSGYINDCDVAGGSLYSGHDIGAVRLTLETNSAFRVDLTASSRNKYTVMDERQVPARVKSAVAASLNGAITDTPDVNVTQVTGVTLVASGSGGQNIGGV